MKVESTFTISTRSQPVKQWWRGLHWITEGGRPAEGAGAPAVVPPYYTRALDMTADIQWFSYDLMRMFCSAVDPGRWRTLHSHWIAMTNKPQNGFDGGTPLRDYINRIDLTADAFPRYDKMQRTYQGSVISGKKVGDLIWCEPGVDGIDARNFAYKRGTDDPNAAFKDLAPEAKTLLGKAIANRHYSVAVGTGDPPYHFRSQWGSNCWIVYPFIFDRPIAFEAVFFAAWEESYWPDPLTTYNPV